jgi:hypothetical protein
MQKVENNSNKTTIEHLVAAAPSRTPSAPPVIIAPSIPPVICPIGLGTGISTKCQCPDRENYAIQSSFTGGSTKYWCINK